jgi:glycosyltransferase involved in cell wall biosynthesis
MRLLIITQKIDSNDDVLGFMHGWITAFARTCESVIAVGLFVGKHSFSQNVTVFSLGKKDGEKASSFFSRFKYLWRFYKTIWRERKNYDAVFVHMNYEYLLLGGPIWRLLGKKTILWYAHGYVPTGLPLAEKYATVVCTSTESGFRINSLKKRVVGQAIDTEKCKPLLANPHDIFRIISVGRITPSKDYETLIEAIDILHKKGVSVDVTIFGKAAIHSDLEYERRLKDLVSVKHFSAKFEFAGAVAHDKLPSHFQNADLFVNMGKTGSLDKAVLEAMSAGLPVLTCNEAFEGVLGGFAERLMYGKENTSELAGKIETMIRMSHNERALLGEGLRQIVVRDHSLATFPERILQTIL